jgi:hypothetical protein
VDGSPQLGRGFLYQWDISWDVEERGSGWDLYLVILLSFHPGSEAASWVVCLSLGPFLGLWRKWPLGPVEPTVLFREARSQGIEPAKDR